MPDNISPAMYIATHITASICTRSIEVDDLTPDGLRMSASRALMIYDAIFDAITERQSKSQDRSFQ
jgi:hypothetical protein